MKRKACDAIRCVRERAREIYIFLMYMENGVHGKWATWKMGWMENGIFNNNKK